jgi:hypothetical protein
MVNCFWWVVYRLFITQICIFTVCFLMPFSMLLIDSIGIISGTSGEDILLHILISSIICNVGVLVFIISEPNKPQLP